jgi:serine/threonine-protein kinase
MLPPLPDGEVLRNRYRITRQIGQGGMGNIYLADDLVLQGRLCAIKEVLRDPSLSPDLQQQARNQFYREASVLARLDHPNLPKVSDFFSMDDESRDYLVMDYVPGRDLKEIMDEARQNGRYLPESEVLGWAMQLADALAFMHRQDPPIVHRDIKPSNLKLTPHGLLKLVDFGLVKLLVPEDRTITVVQGLGTAHYTPLEQYGNDSGHTDARTDIYAFGATLYHLLTNEPPAEAKQRFLHPGSFKPPRAVNPELSLNVERAITWALALHPDNRPPSIEVLRDALQTGTGLAVSDDGQTIVVQPTIHLPSLSTPTDRYLLAAAVVLLALAGILTLFPLPLP